MRLLDFPNFESLVFVQEYLPMNRIKLKEILKVYCNRMSNTILQSLPLNYVHFVILGNLGYNFM